MARRLATRLHGFFNSTRVYRDTMVHLAFAVLGIEQAESCREGNLRKEGTRSVCKSPGMEERRVIVSDERRAHKIFSVSIRVSQLANWRMLRFHN
jgi:hypothetical protein